MENVVSYYPPVHKPQTAVTLVAHGLNVKPDAMLPLVNWLTGRGSGVYLVRLAGHREDAVPLTDINLDLWETELLTAYRMAQEASCRSALPLYFLGYSLGALLGQYLVVSTDGPVSFDRQVLIAPAIAIRSSAHLVRLLFPFGEQIRLPSYTPKPYRANGSLPLAFYQALFSARRQVLQAGFGAQNIPTLMVIDPKDELISYRKLARLAKRLGTHSRLVVLDTSPKDRNSRYHHLIIDQPSMGKGNWERVTAEMEAFLFPSG